MTEGDRVPLDVGNGVQVFLETEVYPDKYNGEPRYIEIGHKDLLPYKRPPHIRWVINFYVYYKNDKGERELIENFHASPMVIKVPQQEGDGNTLHWLDPRDGVAKPLNTVIRVDKDGNPHGYATVFEWGDPNIGW